MRKKGGRSIRRHLDYAADSLSCRKDVVAVVSAAEAASPKGLSLSDVELLDCPLPDDNDKQKVAAADDGLTQSDIELLDCPLPDEDDQQNTADDDASFSSGDSDEEEDAETAEIRRQVEAFETKVADVCDNPCSCCHRCLIFSSFGLV
ncbi:MAG: hypothetical protein GY739_00230, partial [Mesoflavibacter sp.]|nr:hypothetical protein [Mesoflavibacter sp.]